MASAPTLINSIEVSEISASIIEAGIIGAHEIVLGGSNSIIRSSTYDFANEPTTKGWYIGGDGHFSLGGAKGITYDNDTINIGDDVQISANLAADSISVGLVNKLNINENVGPVIPGSSPARNFGGMTLGDPTYNYWYANGDFSLGSASNYVRWNGSSLLIKGAITADSGTFTGTVSGSTVIGGSININSGTFSVDSSGNLVATSADITGIVKASSGNIAGINMSAGRLYSGPNGNWANSNTGFYLDSSGYFSLKDKFYWNPDANSGAGQATFTGALSGASGSVTSNFSIGTGCVIGGSLSVGDNVRVNNATADNSATVFKVRGNTSGADTSKFIAKFQNNAPTDMLSIRDDGLVTVSQNLNVSGNTTVTGSINVGSVTGTTPFSGTVQLNGAVYGSGIQSFTPASTNRFTLTLSSTAGANQYRIGTISSSIRFKQDISKMTFDAESYFKLQPSTFRWKEHVQEDLNADYDLGFIAEEAQELGLDNLWFADSDGIPEGIAYERVPLILWSIVSQQHETIKDLYAKIESLEEKIG